MGMSTSDTPRFEVMSGDQRLGVFIGGNESSRFFWPDWARRLQAEGASSSSEASLGSGRHGLRTSSPWRRSRGTPGHVGTLLGGRRGAGYWPGFSRSVVC